MGPCVAHGGNLLPLLLSRRRSLKGECSRDRRRVVLTLLVE